jgi:transcriptional regulator GlxA family with amidase domain
MPPGAEHQRRLILQRFYDLAEGLAHVAESPSLTEACAALGIRARTLTKRCVAPRDEPHTLPALRRLHLARQALRKGSPGETSVTEIATSSGFWELGRFAVVYRSVSGESPSETLRSEREVGP